MLFNAAVDDLERRIAVWAAPYQRELELLKSVDGFGDAVAQAWLAEIGPPRTSISPATRSSLPG
jgi:hypothetical protein